MKLDPSIVTYEGKVRLIRRSGDIEVEWLFYPTKREKLESDIDDGL